MEFEGTLCNCYRSLPCVRPRRPRWEGLRLAKRMACKSTTFYFTSLHLYIFNTHVNKICRMSPSTPLFVRGQLATSQIDHFPQATLPGIPEAENSREVKKFTLNIVSFRSSSHLSNLFTRTSYARRRSTLRFRKYGSSK